MQGRRQGGGYGGVKMLATSGFLTSLECTKFDFGRGSVPDPAGRAYSAPLDLLAGLRGPTSKGRGGKGTGNEERGCKEVREAVGVGQGTGELKGRCRDARKRGEKRREREEEGEEGEGRKVRTPLRQFLPTLLRALTFCPRPMSLAHVLHTTMFKQNINSDRFLRTNHYYTNATGRASTTGDEGVPPVTLLWWGNAPNSCGLVPFCLVGAELP